MKEAIEIQLESRIVQALKEVCTVPVTGFFAEAAEGEMKQTDATSVAVSVKPRVQLYEPHELYSVELDIRLYVESCESKGGGLFVEEFTAIAELLEKWATGDGCTELSTNRFNVAGMQQNAGGDLDFDVTVKQWMSVWSCTLTGRINN